MQHFIIFIRSKKATGIAAGRPGILSLELQKKLGINAGKYHQKGGKEDGEPTEPNGFHSASLDKMSAWSTTSSVACRRWAVATGMSLV
jgi:hypothetical protein